MTTDVRVASTVNVLKENEIIYIPCAAIAEGAVLSAASFSISLEAQKPLGLVLRFIYKLVAERFSQYDFWLFLGNSATQPDTRVVRHKKLWGALRTRGFEIPDSNDAIETMVEVGGGVKFFGVMCFYESSIEIVADLIVHERCSYIAALPKSFDFRRALDMRWTGEISKDFDWLRCVSKAGGIVFKRAGEFDDAERGFVAIALPEVIKELLI
ncbi:hypothetical protein [Pseudomonas syringae]|uniref:hypothetical protein n=1 Tax=Pseudomonas syringae TaxID=317 RepID=UPI00217F8A87|nr:hypothetical protein [Pseudomonas syringae]